jgi:chromate transporter
MAHDGRLREVVRLFLRLGTTAFGGPAAHIALTRHEVVERKQWLEDVEFARLIGLSNLVPGPNSTEVAMHVGRVRAGWRGLVGAGVAFILPACLMMLGLAWLYDEYGTRPTFQSVLAGITPVVVVLVAQAILQLSRSSLRSIVTILIAIAAFIAAMASAHELVILAVAGLVALLVWRIRSDAPPRGERGAFATSPLVPMLPLLHDAAPVVVAVDPATLTSLFLVFLEIGAVLYGSGYVLYAFLESQVVDQRHWITEQQLVDAIAIGQVTPGPVFTTATFVGYLVRGVPGAIVATVAIFLPAFCFVGATDVVVRRLRDSAAFAAFLSGVVAGSIALMLWVTLTLGDRAFVDGWTVAVAVAAAIVLAWRSPNPVWLIAGGALAGVLIPGLG